MREFHIAECGCGNVSELNPNEQRWHMEDFEVITLHEDNTATYKCLQCEATLRSEIREEEVPD